MSKIAYIVPGNLFFNILNIQKSGFIPFLLIPIKKVDYDIDKHVFIEIKYVKTGLKLVIF